MFKKFTALLGALFCCVAFAADATTTYPLPGPFESYRPTADLSGAQVGDTVFEAFISTVADPGAPVLHLFEVWGALPIDPLGTDPYEPAYYAEFELYINEALTPWTLVLDGPYLYHLAFDISLTPSIVDNKIALVLSGLPVGDTVAPTGALADMIIGGPGTIPAIPLPASALLLLGGLLGLAGLRHKFR